VLGRRYPEPLIEPASALRAARARLGAIRATPHARAEAVQVLERHTSAQNSRMLSPLPARKTAPDSGQLVMEF
jgi:deoxyribodipyrimidine photo-lyase